LLPARVEICTVLGHEKHDPPAPQVEGHPVCNVQKILESGYWWRRISTLEEEATRSRRRGWWEGAREGHAGVDEPALQS
jgi:hypothetical protein